MVGGGGNYTWIGSPMVRWREEREGIAWTRISAFIFTRISAFIVTRISAFIVTRIRTVIVTVRSETTLA